MEIGEKGWIGVVGSTQAAVFFEERPWWCMPMGAKKKDLILMYCPSSVSRKWQGLFALCELKSDPDPNHENKYFCTGFGGRPAKHSSGSLSYTELIFLKRYKKTLSAKNLKNDSKFSRLNFVKRNFQGTTFVLDKKTLLELINSLERINHSVI